MRSSGRLFARQAGRRAEGSSPSDYGRIRKLLGPVVEMQPTGNYSGPCRHLTVDRSGYVRLTNAYLGDARPLDTDSSTWHQAFMCQTGNYGTQLWRLRAGAEDSGRGAGGYLRVLQFVYTACDTSGTKRRTSVIAKFTMGSHLSLLRSPWRMHFV